MSGFDSFHGMLATCNFITVKRKGTHCTWSVLVLKKFKYKYKYKYIDFEIIKYKYKYKYGNFEQVQVYLNLYLNPCLYTGYSLIKFQPKQYMLT